MSDTSQVTYEQVLISRLTTRIGQMSVAMEEMQMRIESFQQVLRQNGIDPDTLQPLVTSPASSNGEVTSPDSTVSSDTSGGSDASASQPR